MLDESCAIVKHREHLLAHRSGDRDTVALDVDYVLAHCCERSRAWVLSHLDAPLSADGYARLAGCYTSFVGGAPLAYVLGSQPFMNLDITVTKDTLIPRADTESLLTWVLARWDKSTCLRVADCGTGSGAIAVTLAHERPSWEVIATDLSLEALAVCEANARRAGVTVACLAGSWYEPLSGCFDMIVSNPPYLAKDDPHLPALTHEPLCALVSEDDGMADLRHLIKHAPPYLAAGGVLVLEHGATQGLAVRSSFSDCGWSAIATYPDIAGRDRFTVGEKA